VAWCAGRDAEVVNHKERLRAAIAGRPVDRPPVSLWRHNFLREWSADDLADETLLLYRQFDWDLVKVNPRWSYLPEVWGNRYQPSDRQRFQRLIHAVVTEPGDLDTIEPGDRHHPALVEQLDAVEAVVAAVGDEVDVIHTVFSPLAVLGLLVGEVGGRTIEFIEANPSGAQKALLAIRETVADHVEDALARGAAGTFYAPLPWTSLDLCPADFYAQYGRPHDLFLLERMAEAPVRVLHICGDNIGAARFDDYPINVASWDDQGRGNPPMGALAGQSGRAVMAGVPHRRIHRLELDEVAGCVHDAVGELEAGFILAGGCAVGAEVSVEHLRAVRDVVEAW